jgi:hypothetical protein
MIKRIQQLVQENLQEASDLLLIQRKNCRRANN